MFKGKVWPALLCNAASFPPTLNTTDWKAHHFSTSHSESMELLKEKPDCKSFQGQTAAEPLASTRGSLEMLSEGR